MNTEQILKITLSNTSYFTFSANKLDRFVVQEAILYKGETPQSRVCDVSGLKKVQHHLVYIYIGLCGCRSVWSKNI